MEHHFEWIDLHLFGICYFYARCVEVNVAKHKVIVGKGASSDAENSPKQDSAPKKEWL